jgi:hypothetical protein
MPGVLLIPALVFTIAITAPAQHDATVTQPPRENLPAQAPHNAAVAQKNVGKPSPSSAATNPAPDVSTGPRTILENSAAGGDNPYDPLLEPPPLPKGSTTPGLVLCGWDNT